MTDLTDRDVRRVLRWAGTADFECALDEEDLPLIERLATAVDHLTIARFRPTDGV